MRIGLLESPRSASLRARLRSLAATVFAMDPARVQELTTESADLVYVVPFEALSAPGWSALRVRLARSTRQFVVAGDGLGSAEFMAAVRDGAYEVVNEGDAAPRWKQALTHAAEAQRIWLQLYRGAAAPTREILSGHSAVMRALRQTVEKLAPTDVTVLILGESGVGKERVARALHEASRRKHFVALNCAAIPKDLLEAELFGVEKGAYTGAIKTRAGLVEQAARGTLFLDEIGEMDVQLQPKLLRFLETRHARRVGSDEEYPSQARVIAATNRDLHAEVAEHRFRSDLYYRLAEMTLVVPPLRERIEDLPGLTQVFLRLANERFGKNVEFVDPLLVQQLQAYSWPGNVRELKSVIDRLVLLYDGPTLREGWWEAPRPAPVAPKEPPSPNPERPPSPLPSRKHKRELAKRLLVESDNNFTWVAAQLGINPSTLWRWRKTGTV